MRHICRTAVSASPNLTLPTWNRLSSTSHLFDPNLRQHSPVPRSRRRYEIKKAAYTFTNYDVSSVFWNSYDLHRASRVTHDGLGYAAEKEPFESPAPMRAHDNQVGRPFCSKINNDRFRVTFLHSCRHLKLAVRSACAVCIRSTSPSFRSCSITGFQSTT